MSEIDTVIAALGSKFHHLSGETYIRIMDTPHVWGMDFGPQIMDQARSRQEAFARVIEEVVQKTRFRCDIASLNAPDPDWIRVIIGAIDTCLSEPMGRTRPVQFRFLFGQTPMVPFGEPENYTALKAALVRLVRERSSAWEQMPEFWLGRFYRLGAGIMSSLQAKVFGMAVIGAEDIKMTWNHAKAVAADGTEALVGGHNLNMDLFRSYPPVHDASAAMHGDAAFGVQLFLDQMWACATDLLTKEHLELPARVWRNADSNPNAPQNPFDDPGVKNAVEAAQAALLALHRSGRQTGQDPVYPAPPPPAPGVRDNDLQTLGEVREPAFPERLFWKLYAGFDEYKPATRVLSLGKYWSGSGSHDYQDGAEIMKQTLISGARRSIQMSQMDVVSAWKKDWRDHHVCHWLIDALLNNKDLTVRLVVSPLDAGAGAAGDQYSFGSGAVRTFALMKYYMFHTIDDHPIADPDGVRAAALQRLEIAPFFYTDKVPADCTTEGSTYKWPDLSPQGYTATLKQPPLEAKPPRDGIIGSAAWSVVNASGYIYDKIRSAPGNHAKIMIVDEEAYVIGSDNLYPGYLSEFDYLVEGEEAVRRLLDDYWTPLWSYSAPHKIHVDEKNYTRSLPAAGVTGSESWSDSPPAGKRLIRIDVGAQGVITFFQATYEGAASGGHGNRGEHTTITLEEDEYLTQVSGRYGLLNGVNTLCELVFTTNKRTVPKIGSAVGVDNVSAFDLHGESGEAVFSFFGSKNYTSEGGSLISSLGVVLVGG